MSRSDETEVLVVGAGPVGLTLGCELLRRGVRATIVDALPRPTSQSRATDLQSRSLEILEAMGVVDRFLAEGRRVNRVRFVSERDEVFRLDFAGLEGPYPFLLSLPQPRTEALLSGRLEELGGRVERPLNLVGLSDDGEHVTARLEGPGGPFSMRARWVVGCDGANSTVRRLLGRSFEGHAFEQSFVIADVLVDGGLAPDEITLHMHQDGFLTVLALPGEGLYRLFFDADPALTEAPGFEAVAAMAELRSHGELRAKGLSWASCFRIHQRLVDRYRTGRVLLAGNAAHVHSPAGGQGMNTGIQDAWNLGWKLAMVARGAASEALLDSYHDERRPIARAILLETEIATRSSLLRSPVARALRDAGARLSGLLAPLAHALESRCAELDLGYDEGLAVHSQRAPLWTAPVLDDRSSERASLADRARFARAPHAGDRAPDVAGLFALGPSGELDGPVALRDLLRHEGFTLLLFDGEAATDQGYEQLRRVALRCDAEMGGWARAHVVVVGERAPAGKLEGCSVVLDPEGALHSRYGASSECLYLIRPDGYVGFRCQPADEKALVAFLARMFVASEEAADLTPSRSTASRPA